MTMISDVRLHVLLALVGVVAWVGSSDASRRAIRGDDWEPMTPPTVIDARHDEASCWYCLRRGPEEHRACRLIGPSR